MVWSNCRLYNTIPDSFILKACSKAEDIFNSLWQEAGLPEFMSGRQLQIQEQSKKTKSKIRVAEVDQSRDQSRQPGDKGNLDPEEGDPDDKGIRSGNESEVGKPQRLKIIPPAPQKDDALVNSDCKRKRCTPSFLLHNNVIKDVLL